MTRNDSNERDASSRFAEDLAELESAEDFLAYFGIDYEPGRVHICRLHILQRFHDYLEGHRQRNGEPTREDYRALLQHAYADFVDSDAQTEKVFRVFKKAAGIATVPVSAITRAGPR
ncbi:nitrogen fixation protein NifW [Rhodocyclus tenuis]|uniref:Nitrogenase-stabilizing/protective protein NifW n=1 Tax=Rhodocyclus gracilis TaxID=2929842 RepID=A0ABX0WL44_9RHOO|nr:nitrogenase-stabilizing/protective protein NifW [Rhodocyclus gracilis]MRD72417.1 nitrogen fixation protein NifW [Rhodocyclus gracilis]NJA89497.1 nitrogen fixation protein NifW [Rhodocyclus gracilis]